MVKTAHTSLTKWLQAGPYQAYTYSYPHKTAYRALTPSRPLSAIWAEEQQRNLFLYLHIPFCEMRCGFCNLFTTVNAPQSLTAAYLDALERQALAVRAALPEATFSRLALGGGTPTFLETPELERLFNLLERTFDASSQALPCSVETSPATATPERLKLLAGRGVQRMSIGIQSFVEEEVRSVGRAQRNQEVFTALDEIRAAGLPVLNIDLIYGLAHQTPGTWLYSLQTALQWQPEELFLYPLYVRPLTGIARLGRSWDDERQELYQLGRDFLLSQGYVQTSMRRFQRSSLPLSSEPEYTCQLDGMVGLGCGARSYTRRLHYSSEYAVGAVGVREIIQDFVQRSEDDFALAQHGFELGGQEQRRRFLLQSLLHHLGLDLGLYRQTFGTEAWADHPDLTELLVLGLAVQNADHLTLTPAGLALSDAIGPWLYSPQVQALSAGYAWR